MNIESVSGLPEVLRTIARGLRWRICLGKVLTRIPLIAGFSLVPALVILLPALANAALPVPLLRSLIVWLAAFLAGAIAIAIPSLIRRITPDQAADWLDRRQKRQNLFSAAWQVQRKSNAAIDPNSGPYDQLIVTQAQSALAELPPRLESVFPSSALKRQSAVASISSIVCIALIALAALGLNLRQQNPGDPGNLGTVPDLAESDSGTAKPDPDSAKEQARSLFPNDQRLAGLAADAISRGDMNALQDLLDQAGSASQKLSDRIGNAQSEPRLPDGGPEPQRGTKSQPGKPGDGNSGNSDSGKSGKTQKDKQSQSDRDNSQRPRDKSGSQGENPNSGKQKSSRGGQQGNSGKNQRPDLNRGGNQALNDANKGGGNAADGSATGPSEANSEKVQTGGDLLISQNKINGRFEMFLGAAGAKTPLSQIIPGSSSQALRALETSQAPLQYERYVQSYFRALAQEVKP